MISILTDENICAVTERVLTAAAAFSVQNQKKEIAPIFIIVPDRATLAAERVLLSRAPVLLNVRVVTFSMLYNVLAGEGAAVLDKTSAVLYTWRAIQDVRKDLVYFANSVDQYAFSEKIFNTINQLQSCMADFDTLEKNAKSPVTARKMHDISLIQKRYKELAAGYIDGAGILAWLISNVARNETVKNAHIYMTGFEHLSVQREEVIRNLARAARSFTAGVQKDGELSEVINAIRSNL